MANPNSTEKYVVKHPKMNFSVGGKLQRVPVGTHIMLTDAAALDKDGKIKPSLKGKIKSFKEAKVVKAEKKG